jgi:transposase
MAREIGCGTSMQALRERRARQERADAHQAALLVQGLRPELYRHPTRGKPLALKVAAVLLYVSGLSMNRTAKLLGVSTPTIQAWLEQFAAAYAQKPEPEGRAVVIELDEMWHYLKKSPNPSGSGRLGIVLQGDWWTGNAGVVTRPPASA